MGQRTSVVQATLQLRPTSGPVGTSIAIRGSGFYVYRSCEAILISFTDASGLTTQLKTVRALDSFKTNARIPDGASLGAGTITAQPLFFLGDRCYSSAGAATPFTVTPGKAAVAMTDVLVNAPSSGPFWTNSQYEPVIAQNPTNPLNIIVSAQDWSAEPPCSDTTPSVCIPTLPTIPQGPLSTPPARNAGAPAYRAGWVNAQAARLRERGASIDASMSDDRRPAG